MNKMLVILGATATGKTDLALLLAKKFNGELVACDSRQVYKGLDIGTGKTSRMKGEGSRVKKGGGFWEIEGVKIWMYDVVELPRQYSVFEYEKQANEAIGNVFTRGKLPIVVGGTGLYLKALIDGLDNLKVPYDKKLRKKLEVLSVLELQKKLDLLSPAVFERLNNSDRNNPRRLVRAIELAVNSKHVSSKQKKLTSDNLQLDILKIGLTAPRPWLYQKIDIKVLEWFKEGIVSEVSDLIKNGVPVERFKELGLEYREIADNLISKKYPDKDLIQVIQAKIRQYAKRQMTWFKKEKCVNWIDITQKNWIEKVDKLVGNWYNLPILDD